MSLRRALEALPDDRDTSLATRDVVAFFAEHPNERMTPERVTRATSADSRRVQQVISALAAAFVLDCGGSDDQECMFTPTPMLSLEIQRYLRSSPGEGAKLQRGAQRFRDRFGTR